MDKWLKLAFLFLLGGVAALGHSGAMSPEMASAVGCLAGGLAGLFHSKPGSKSK